MTALFQLPKAISLAGAKLTFTLTGTTTAQNTYTNEALTIASSNPVVADASGVFAPIYLDPRLPSYRVKLTTSADVLIYQVDNYPSNQNITTGMRIESTTPELWFYDTDGSANSRKFRVKVSGGTFDVSLSNDAENAFTQFIYYDAANNGSLSLNGYTPWQGAAARKLNGSSIISSTTLANDPDLTIDIASGGVYAVEGQVEFNCTSTFGAMGIKLGLNYSGGLTSNSKTQVVQFVNGTGSIALSSFSNAAPLTAATITDDSGFNQVRFSQCFRFSTAGTLTLQRAQNSSTAHNLEILANSWMRVQRLGGLSA